MPNLSPLPYTANSPRLMPLPSSPKLLSCPDTPPFPQAPRSPFPSPSAPPSPRRTAWAVWSGSSRAWAARLPPSQPAASSASGCASSCSGWLRWRSGSLTRSGGETTRAGRRGRRQTGTWGTGQRQAPGGEQARPRGREAGGAVGEPRTEPRWRCVCTGLDRVGRRLVAPPPGTRGSGRIGLSGLTGEGRRDCCRPAQCEPAA